MTDHIATFTPEQLLDDTEHFVRAMSICAELEGRCGLGTNTRVLALVGLAACELSEYGARLPARFEPVQLESVDQGLALLDALLTGLIRDADDLATALWIHEAREFIRYGIRVSACA